MIGLSHARIPFAGLRSVLVREWAAPVNHQFGQRPHQRIHSVRALIAGHPSTHLVFEMGKTAHVMHSAMLAVQDAHRFGPRMLAASGMDALNRWVLGYRVDGYLDH